MLSLTLRRAARPLTRSTLNTLRPLSTTVPRKLESTNIRQLEPMPAQSEIPVAVAGPEGREHTTIKVEEVKFDPSVNQDVQQSTFAFDREAAKRLTPTMKKFTNEGKVALVTGGARGLGWNMCQALAESGVKAIAVLDVQQELGVEAATQLAHDAQIPVKFYKTDIRDENAVNSIVQDVVDDFGSVDIVINSAGIADSNIKAETYDPNMFRRLIDINVTGAFLVAQACGKQMIANKTPGSIIFIASMSGSIVNYPQEQSCYNASKAAVIQLSKSLAAEWSDYGIRVNSISPGYMDTALNRVPTLEGQKKIWTSLTPQQRLGQVDELNGLAVFLASDASTFVTGANMIIDGGYSVY